MYFPTVELLPSPFKYNIEWWWCIYAGVQEGRPTTLYLSGLPGRCDSYPIVRRDPRCCQKSSAGPLLAPAEPVEILRELDGCR